VVKFVMLDNSPAGIMIVRFPVELEHRRAKVPLHRQAKSSGLQPLYQIAVTVWPACSGMIFYESAFLATFCIEYSRGTTYEKPHGTVNVLY